MKDKTLTEEMQRLMAFFYVATKPKEFFKEGIDREQAMLEIMKDFDSKQLKEDLKKYNEDKDL